MMLLERGADPNAADDDWWTPLHVAASAGQRPHTEIFSARLVPAQPSPSFFPQFPTTSGAWRICNKLLEAGADPTAVNANGDLPFDLCSDTRVEGVLQREMEARGLGNKVSHSRRNTWLPAARHLSANMTALGTLLLPATAG